MSTGSFNWGRMTTGEKKNCECAACGKEARAWLWPDDGEQGYGLALIREDGKQPAALPVCEECYDTEIGRHAVMRKWFDKPDLMFLDGDRKPS
jgi:hypothetical protein